jgi:hypothetical protein
VVVSLATLLLAIFGSGTIGDFINQITYAVLGCVNGVCPGLWYSGEWKRLSGNLRKKVVKRDGAYLAHDPNAPWGPFRDRWTRFTADVFLSFFWQQGPKGLVEWVSRRNTVFIKACTSLGAAILGLIVYVVLVWSAYFSCRCWSAAAVCGVAGLFLVPTMWGGLNARKEARQMVDLWFGSLFDDEVRGRLTEIRKRCKDPSGSGKE